MRKITHLFIIVVASMLLAGCDYWSWFDFKIINSTGDSITVSYIKQMRSFTTMNYTPGYEDDYMSIRLAKMATDTIIPPGQSFVLHEMGARCGRDFPYGLEDPKEYGIVPLWERIVSMTIKGDTLEPEIYAQELWWGKGSTYTLAIKRYMHSDKHQE